MKTEKTEMEKYQGMKRFLIPVNVLPDKVTLVGKGGIVRLIMVGTIIDLNGQAFVKVETWKHYSK